MAVEWLTTEEQKRRARMADARYADKRYYTNADRTELVPEGSPDAAYLVVGEGGEVTDEMAEKYGIKGKAKEAEPEKAGIVVSGGTETGPSFVEAAQSAEDGEESGDTKRGAKKAGKK
jgi:hypothetical protein